MPSQEVAVLLFTAATAEDVARIGRILVEERLAACMNVVPGIRAIYRWEGKVVDEPEALGIAKLPRKKADAAIARIKVLHAYAVPEAVAVPIVAGSPDYLKWVLDATE